MPLKNYRTTVTVERTAQEIQRLLLRVKATQISISYWEGKPTGVDFHVMTRSGERAYALPIRSDQVRKALLQEGLSQRFATPNQAERVAWRIAKDWLAAQVALIEMGMSE